MNIRLGSRPSRLAIRQAELVAESLRAIGVDSTIIEVESVGDNMKDEPLFSMSDRGVFVSKLNEALMRGEIDAAVHSAKDLPSVLTEGVVISAVLPREDPSDVLVSSHTLKDMPPGSIIGSSSLRRIAMIKRFRPDLEVRNVRGNVDTRLKKLDKGEFSGIVIAQAGLSRLGLDPHRERLIDYGFVPAPAQGIVAVVTGKNGKAYDLCQSISHRETEIELECERNLVRTLELGCSSPAGIYCSLRPDSGIDVAVSLYSRKTSEFIDVKETIKSPDYAVSLGKRIRERIPESFGYYL